MGPQKIDPKLTTNASKSVSKTCVPDLCGGVAAVDFAAMFWPTRARNHTRLQNWILHSSQSLPDAIENLRVGGTGRKAFKKYLG